MRSPPRILACFFAAVAVVCVSRCFADGNVVVTAFADPEYTQRKYTSDGTKAETYVVMRGRFYEGCTVDNSIDKMPFRRLTEVLAPELSRLNFTPAKELKEADLLIVVHWGTTNPRVNSFEMTGRTSPVTDMSNSSAGMAKRIEENNARAADGGAQGAQEPQIMLSPAPGGGAMTGELDRQLDFDRDFLVTEQMSSQFATANNAQLLGYTEALRKYGRKMEQAQEEITLRHDLTKERYFIILCAYDLHKAANGGARTPEWTIHMNMSSAGNNFRTALFRMSVSSVKFVGRTTDDVKTIKPETRQGTVEIGTPIILGEAK